MRRKTIGCRVAPFFLNGKNSVNTDRIEEFTG